ncbi:MAG TPA: XcyI family restriction endonuclease [Pseudonocardiaceae bacterium]|nr:XcyI family restriction endonuclease [Pseudonocardiaceae bacterium]
MDEFNFPPPARQIYIHAFLDKARSTVLHAAVKSAAAKVNPATLRQEMTRHVPAPGLQSIQGTGVRDELIFAAPCILRMSPATLGYYRLLLGVSQKRFYTKATRLSIFKSMEDRGIIHDDAESRIASLCSTMNEAMSGLVTAILRGDLQADIDQLPLLTLGAQADGSWRTRIGQKATKGVFDALKNVIKGQGKHYTDNGDAITVVNSAGRNVTLALSPDPDVVIKEEVNTQIVVKTAIEIKGGTDNSNVHNRAGEAEKSHRKAHQAGAQKFWTVIFLTGVDRNVLCGESPTTREWFDLEEVLAEAGADWQRLVDLTISAMGI